ncbi:universal stress protein [Peptococcaceae bacterium 1198_IL3148]
MDKILVAVDGYEPSLGAVKKAIELASMYNAEVIALKVQENSPLLMAEKKYEATRTTGIIYDDVLNLVTEYARQKKVRLQTIEFTGVVAGTILQISRNHKVDIIVMGDTARSGLEKMHFGSVAESVLKRSHVPVLVVKRGTVDISDIRQLAMEHKKMPMVNKDASSPLLKESWSKNFFLSFGFLTAFMLLYFTTAIINTTSFQTTAGILLLNVPLGVWLSFMIFPASLTLCWFYLRLGR